MNSGIVEYIFGGVSNIRAVYARGVTHCFPRHSHESLIIGVVLCGCNDVISEGEKMTINSGEQFQFLPYQEHSCEFRGNYGCDYFALAIPLHYIRGLEDSMNLQLLKKEISLLSEKMSLTASDFGAICELLENIESTVMQLKAVLKDNMDVPELVGRGLQFIRENYSLKLSLDDVASFSYMSKYHFLRVFTNSFGMSPRAYVDKKRVDEAITRVNSGESACGVALGCGFSDQSHMCRVAKKITGVNVGKYTKVYL